MAELDDLLREVDAAVDEIVRFHQDIVRIPTVNTGQMPTGNETACCEYIRDRLGAEGIGAKILESAPGRGNLIARLKGDGSGPSLLLMSHLDVVPVEDPARWRYPPFEAVLAEGRIWGRGSDDAKAVATAGYFATVLLKRSGLRLKGDLIYTATADEESGGFYGYGWLARNAPEEIRADYALNEGGGYPVRSRRGLVYEVGIGEKGRVEATITIGGRSGHASRPWDADNALLKAGRVLNLIENYRPEIDLSSPVFDYLHEIDAGLGRPRPPPPQDPGGDAGPGERNRPPAFIPAAGPLPDDPDADGPPRWGEIQQHPGERDPEVRRPDPAGPGRKLRPGRAGKIAGRHRRGKF
jgi:acetylornithine deacetylase/succinyl-diaminopimelate desuccinylase-like protein